MMSGQWFSEFLQLRNWTQYLSCFIIIMIWEDFYWTFFHTKKEIDFFLKLSFIMILEMMTLFFNDEKKTYIQILKCSTKFYNNNNVMSCIFKVKNLLFRELVKIVLISRNFKVFFRVFFYREIYLKLNLFFFCVP